MVHPHDIFSPLEPWTIRIVSLAREFVKTGSEVTLIYFPLEWKNQRSFQPQERFTVVPLCRKLGIRHLLANVVKTYRIAGAADIIHFQKCFYYAVLPALIAGFFRKKPLHYDWDDWEVKIYEASTKPGILRTMIWHFINILERNIPRLVDTVSCASQRLKLECERLSIPPERIFDAPVGADLMLFHPGVSGNPIREKYRIDKQLVLYVGQLHGGQYVDLFIDTAEHVLRKYEKDIYFMIVGEGYQSGRLKKRAEELGIQSRVIFTGAVTHNQIPHYVAAADVCVACFEDNDVTRCKSPLKIAEYLASGKAIVASEVGEISTMLGDGGVLAEPGSIESLAQGICKIIDNEKYKRQIGVKARRRAQERYNWTTTAQQILSAYTKTR